MNPAAAAQGFQIPWCDFQAPQANDRSPMNTNNTPFPRILIVEDNTLSYTMTAMMMERLTGVMPERACTGEEAITRLKETHFDLVIMDQFMPGMSGNATTERIRQELPSWKQPCILGLSGSSTRRDIERAREAGMDGFLAKPLRLVDLQAAIAVLVAREPLAMAVG
jgi:CheY-like chemotaxis protein